MNLIPPVINHSEVVEVWSSYDAYKDHLMEKAEKGAGGAVVSVIAYKGEYVATQDELKVIDATARDKKCKTPENWSSTSAIR